MKWRAQLNRGILEYLTLILLEKKKHGYEVLQLLRSNLSITKEIADGPIYALLSRLKKEGILLSEEKIVDNRRRIYFQLSKDGENVLETMKKDWGNLIIEVDKFSNLELIKS